MYLGGNRRCVPLETGYRENYNIYCCLAEGENAILCPVMCFICLFSVSETTSNYSCWTRGLDHGHVHTKFLFFSFASH